MKRCIEYFYISLYSIGEITVLKICARKFKTKVVWDLLTDSSCVILIYFFQCWGLNLALPIIAKYSLLGFEAFILSNDDFYRHSPAYRQPRASSALAQTFFSSRSQSTK